MEQVDIEPLITIYRRRLATVKTDFKPFLRDWESGEMTRFVQNDMKEAKK